MKAFDLTHNLIIGIIKFVAQNGGNIGVLSDDFAAVDVREELCYHSRPKKRKFKRYMEQE